MDTFMDNETVTFSQHLVKAHRNEEKDVVSKVVSKNVVIDNDSTLEQRVDRLIDCQIQHQSESPNNTQ